MAASDHVNGQQLRMFMTAQELSDGSSGIRLGESPGGKLYSARKSGMADDIAKHGVQEPVNVMHWEGGTSEVIDGNHRVAAALAHNPQSYVPVVHHDNEDELNEHRQTQYDRSTWWDNHDD